MIHPAISWTIWLTMACYFPALAMRLASPPISRWARILWSLGLIFFLAHFVAAFHFYHVWSHDSAYDHNLRVAGFGPGIFVSYAFTGLWMLETIGWWLTPNLCRSVPRWLESTYLAAHAFIMFNGSIVFESGFSRAFGIVGFAYVALSLRERYAARRRP